MCFLLSIPLFQMQTAHLLNLLGMDRSCRRGLLPWGSVMGWNGFSSTDSMRQLGYHGFRAVLAPQT